MKRNILFALSAIVLGVAGYVGYQRVSASSESDLFLANVEALSQNENVVILQCTRGIEGANCVRRGRYGKEFVCAIFTKVEDYETTTTSPIICKHDAVGRCPYGTEEEPWDEL